VRDQLKSLADPGQTKTPLLKAGFICITNLNKKKKLTDIGFSGINLLVFKRNWFDLSL
jgi:hypothetical protein